MKSPAPVTAALLGLGLASGLGLVSGLGPVRSPEAHAAAETSSPPAPSLRELDSLLALARRARDQGAAGAWFAVAQAALTLEERAPGLRPDDRQRVQKDREQSLALLAPTDLAALGARFAMPRPRSPALGLAFARAVLEHGHPEEAARECRALLGRMGPKEAPEALDLWKRAGVPGDGPGGVSQSVYRIGIVLPRDAGAAEPEKRSLMRGFRAGLFEVLGPRADLFLTDSPPGGEAAEEAADPAALLERGAGLLLAEGQDLVVANAVSAGAVAGVPVLDARAEVPLSEGPGLAEGPSRELRSPGGRAFRGAYVIRPGGEERGRRLAEYSLPALGLTSVALALPEVGGDAALARGFRDAALALGARVTGLSYAAGRRDYRNEVAAFRATGAEAICLAGPAEECGEWALALAAARLKPAILGSEELAPENFHERERTALEGAVYVAAGWRLPAALAARAAAVPAADSTGSIVDPGFVRGFLLGRRVGASVRAGAFTPTLLGRVFEAASVASADGDRHLVFSPDEAVLPLFRCRAGRAEPISSPEAASR